MGSSSLTRDLTQAPCIRKGESKPLDHQGNPVRDILKTTSPSRWGFPGGSLVKNPPASEGDTRDMCSVPGLGRSPGEGNRNPLQYSCLENSMDRGTWWATVHGVAKSQTQLSDYHTRTCPILTHNLFLMAPHFP